MTPEVTGYEDMNGYGGYVYPVVDLVEVAASLPDDTIHDLLKHGVDVVSSFTSEDTAYNSYWGVYSNKGIPVMGTSSAAIFVADMAGRGVFLDDYLWDAAHHPLLEGIGWYYNPVKWAIAALSVQDLLGVHPSWGPDQYNLLTLPWVDIVGPIPMVDKRVLLKEVNDLGVPKLW